MAEYLAAYLESLDLIEREESENDFAYDLAFVNEANIFFSGVAADVTVVTAAEQLALRDRDLFHLA